MATTKSKNTGFVGLINKSGEFVVLPRYESIFHIVNGKYSISKYDETTIDPNTKRYKVLYGVIDRHGHELIPFEYDEIEMLDANTFQVKKDSVESILIVPKTIKKSNRGIELTLC
ncbi:MAG: WG repeat-containing protein [Bacteroidales bacterium]|nr:WG repeat-containing protein [Bacteroidales bacterium]